MFPSLSIPNLYSLDLQLSKQVSDFVRNTTPGIFSKILGINETSDQWNTYETLIHSCLRTGDDESAHKCLQRLIERFGADDERVKALAGIYKEVVAQDDEELEKILDEYNYILLDDPTNLRISKRRIALLKSLGRPIKAISALITFLDSSPNDAEAWAELSDLYVAQGMYPQAIFALEELLLVTPFAWNIHARLGEVLYMSDLSTDNGKEKLIYSLQSYCRSIELCDDYLRGYYGLKLVTDRILVSPQSDLEAKSYDNLTVEKLNELATAKLMEILRRNSQKECGWQRHNASELKAAKKILNHGA